MSDQQKKPAADAAGFFYFKPSRLSLREKQLRIGPCKGVYQDNA
jgi:hypothetical protein